jgi:hypothetical protein
MADDVNPALRAELEAALAVLEPEIRGLHDLTTVSISTELQTEINKQIDIREHRRDLIQSVLNSMNATNAARNALEADGYPALPDAVLSPVLFSELKGEDADITAAIGVFEEKLPATTMSIGLGAPVDKPPA